MKKPTSIVVFVLLSIFFYSCSKDDVAVTADPAYFIKGKKDGVTFIFTANTLAMGINPNGGSLVSLLASGSGSEGFNIGLSLYDGTTLQTGTYSEDYTGTNYAIGGLYNPNSTTIVYSAGIQPSVKPLVINILSKTSTEVSGTFSGAFYKQSTSGTFYPDFIMITEGEFNLQIK